MRGVGKFSRDGGEGERMRCNSFQKYVNKQKRKQMNKKEKEKIRTKKDKKQKKLWMRGGKILNNNFLNYS